MSEIFVVFCFLMGLIGLCTIGLNKLKRFWLFRCCFMFLCIYSALFVYLHDPIVQPFNQAIVQIFTLVGIILFISLLVPLAIPDQRRRSRT